MTAMTQSNKKTGTIKKKTGNIKSITTDPIRQYLVEIGRIKLLKPEEEITLGHQVVKLVRLEEVRDRLQEQLGQEPSIEEWAKATGIEHELLNHTIKAGRRARDRMVEANLRLVVSVAKKYPRRGLDLLSLVQEGNIGLQRAAEKFDPERGYKFSTYAHWWIRQAITRAIADKSRTIRLPIHVTERLNKYKKVSRELSMELGRTPNLGDIAERVGVSQAEVIKVKGFNRKIMSLHAKVGEDKDSELLDLIADPNSQPEVDDAEQEARWFLDALTQKEREVIQARYGLITGEPQSLADIGRAMDVSRERVRQIEAKAMQKMRRAANKRKAVL